MPRMKKPLEHCTLYLPHELDLGSIDWDERTLLKDLSRGEPRNTPRTKQDGTCGTLASTGTSEVRKATAIRQR